ncbi:YheC/YheD family protein [Paenibacillus sp. HN-1]|uniref:YheC/YheD family protein n=1 Tax=Paenibacillus TaxID=44249 RepID=UPI001CAA3491|nr:MULTISPECIES: YheC/YheD family protein [Paenibacillus]MBY9082163.1 YheC/YheD family protein [Paenibacillus sp. CGMCC 1.18879]MBY9082641.1 YheC/YheD family protein [Paenibacillus sinensis]
MRIQRVASKWAKTEAILSDRLLTPYIPETRKFDDVSLSDMLLMYETVYIKPDRGTYGNGVMRAEIRSLSSASRNGDLTKSESDSIEPVQKSVYILRYGTQAKVFRSVEELHRAISDRIGGRLYIIQKGIDLLKFKKRPFDLRVLVQTTLQGNWETTGMLARMAAPQKIVTNYHSGGQVLAPHEPLGSHMSTGELERTLKKLANLGVRASNGLQSAYPDIRELGLDVAIDNHHDIWILEINTMPSLIAFKKFADSSTYRKIRRYAAHYGRSGFSPDSSLRRRPPV